MEFPRASLWLLTAAIAWMPLSGLAQTQNYPTRPITMIVPFPPGGSTDVSARVAGDHMGKTLGQQFVVQNIGGAGGTTGSTRAMQATPDGYTLLTGQMGTHAAAPALYPKLAYRPDVDFEPIGLISEFPVLIAARKDFPANNLKEFVAYVQANESKLNLGHAGVGSIFFTTCLLLNSVMKVKPTMVPFSGGAPTMTALIGGQIDYMCGDAIVGASPYGAGQIKVYAIAAPKRSPALPDVPTTTEAGLPEFQASAWNAMFAPKGTPKAILDRLTDALDKALDDETTRKRLLTIGSDIPERAQRGQQQLRALVTREIARWSPIIKATGIVAQ